MNRLSIPVLLIGLLSAVPAASQTLSAAQAVEMATQHNRSLRISQNDVRQADLGVTAEETVRTPVWSTDGSYRYGKNPLLTSMGSSLSTIDSLVLMTALGHTFSPGTQMSVWFQTGRSVSTTAALGELGSAIDAAIGFEVAQPWLQGFGRDIVDAGIRSAAATRDATIADERQTANTVVQQVLSAYWTLWSTQRAVTIAQDSLVLSQRQLAEAEVKLDAGVLAPSQLTSLRTEVATAHGSLADARGAQREASLNLSDAMGVEPQNWAAVDSEPSRAQLGTLADNVDRAMNQSPELLELQATVVGAQIQAELAHDAARPSLSTTASVQASGLNNEFDDAYAQMGTFEAVVGAVGLRFEMPVSLKSKRARAESAELLVRNAKLRLEDAKRSIATDLATSWNTIDVTVERLRLARETAALAQENVDAQTARYEAGKATALEVTDSIQGLREAEQRVVDLQLQLVLVELEVQANTGTLAPR